MYGFPGIVVPTTTVYGFLLDRYPDGTSSKIGLEIWVYFMVVVYVIQEYRHYKHEGALVRACVSLPP